VLSDRFAGQLSAAGITPAPPVPGVYLGSSDMGNRGEDGSDHTPEFAAAGALACTAADVLLRPDLREAAWAGHRAAEAAEG
jgi:hypothetical protein